MPSYATAKRKPLSKRLIEQLLVALLVGATTIQAQFVPPAQGIATHPEGNEPIGTAGGTRDNGAPQNTMARGDRTGATSWAITPATCMANGLTCTCYERTTMQSLQATLLDAEQCRAELARTRAWVKENFALATPVQPEPAWWQSWPGVVLIVAAGGVIGLAAGRVVQSGK